MKLKPSVLGQNLQKMMEEIIKGVEAGREPQKQVAEPVKPSPERVQQLFG